MADDLEKQANDALLDDNYELAVELHTKGIAANPRKAESQLEAEGLQESTNEVHLDDRTGVSAANSSASPVLAKSVQNFRHAFYESTTEAVVEILAKGLRPEQVKVEFGVQSLKVTIHGPPIEPYVFQRRLNRKVITEKCRYEILGTKVEIHLAKEESVMWKSLEYSDTQMAVQAPVVPKPDAKLCYPSSSKKGQRDWGKLAAEVIKEEKDEKLEGYKLFTDTFKDVDEETRRAMNKSFVESNGTVLSTNWKDVSEKYVEGSLPSGMEMKKWEK